MSEKIYYFIITTPSFKVKVEERTYSSFKEAKQYANYIMIHQAPLEVVIAEKKFFIC